MVSFLDVDAGINKAARRVMVLTSNEINITNVLVGGGAFIEGSVQYTPGYQSFVGQLQINRPLATSIEVRVIPRIADFTTGIFSSDEFVVAVFAAAAGNLNFNFAWGAPRGVLTAASGGTYLFSTQWKLKVANTGGQQAFITVGALECVG